MMLCAYQIRITVMIYRVNFTLSKLPEVNVQLPGMTLGIDLVGRTSFCLFLFLSLALFDFSLTILAKRSEVSLEPGIETTLRLA